ncbi:hypothetical protein DW757_06095 [Clostridium sp. AM29-11AC]|uniref:hypothetical protein n=1 Tax=Clostridium sp. AM29-11AC TaxID=2293028 RepID=UPI000E4DC23A|nr:hypothetical protein [Clostridium sp. AM29-11AC]RHT57984.1 hypothetical protein DW757_06095 [Clostridium sp. AM29-11AC]
MAMGIWLPGGGGADLDVVTAGAGDVLAGKVIVGPDGEPLTGTLALSGNASDGQVLNGQTYYNTDAKTKRTGTMPNRGAVNQSLAINGSYTIPAGYHNGSGKVSQSIPTKGAQTYTPGTTNQTIAAGQYLTGPQTIKGDPNLRPENIKKGVSIMGITGSFEGYVISPLNLFNAGTWGGGQSGYTVMEGPGTYPGNKVSITGGTIRLDTNGGESALLRLNNVVDITNYKYLKIDCPYDTIWSAVGCGISKSSGDTSFDGLTAKYESNLGSGNSPKGTHVLDISGFSGAYWVYIYLLTGGSGSRYAGINRVYLTSN